MRQVLPPLADGGRQRCLQRRERRVAVLPGGGQCCGGGLFPERRVMRLERRVGLAESVVEVLHLDEVLLLPLREGIVVGFFPCRSPIDKIGANRLPYSFRLWLPDIALFCGNAGKISSARYRRRILLPNSYKWEQNREKRIKRKEVCYNSRDKKERRSDMKRFFALLLSALMLLSLLTACGDKKFPRPTTATPWWTTIPRHRLSPVGLP